MNSVSDRLSENRNGLSTLSAFFDDRVAAEDAIRRLKDIGIDDGDVRFMPGYEADREVYHGDHRLFWEGLAGWLFPDEDRATYAEGLRRGGFLVSVQVNDQTYESAHDILDDDGSIDIDERADLWREEGWDGGLAATAALDAVAPGPNSDLTTSTFEERVARNQRDLEIPRHAFGHSDMLSKT